LLSLVSCASAARHLLQTGIHSRFQATSTLVSFTTTALNTTTTTSNSNTSTTTTSRTSTSLNGTFSVDINV
ncbi:unnamed protein product, partial [Closterium sp. Naga37s-1]